MTASLTHVVSPEAAIRYARILFRISRAPPNSFTHGASRMARRKPGSALERHDAADELGAAVGEAVRDGRADRVSDHDRPDDAELIERRRNAVGLRGQRVVRPLGAGRAAHAERLDDDDAVA